MDLTLAGALLAGAATSLHCAGMCGPLACGLGTFAKSEGERLAVASVYHGGRLFSYTVIGAICGGLGKEPLHWLFDSPAMILPWAMVLALLLIATGLEKKIPRPAFLQSFAFRMKLRARNLPLTAGGALSGLLTPLLPCGPLYAMFIALLVAGSAARGAELALAFGLGTVPLLWLAQRGLYRLGAGRSPELLRRIQRGMTLVAALVLAWRLHGTLPLPGNEVAEGKKELPSCCHPVGGGAVMRSSAWSAAARPAPHPDPSMTCPREALPLGARSHWPAEATPRAIIITRSDWFLR